MSALSELQEVMKMLEDQEKLLTVAEQQQDEIELLQKACNDMEAQLIRVTEELEKQNAENQSLFEQVKQLNAENQRLLDLNKELLKEGQ